MNTSVIAVEPWQLALTTVFVVAVLLLIAVMKLGLAKQFAIASLRTYVQVLLLGYALSWIFKLDSGLVILGILMFMTGVAALISAKRVNESGIPGTILPTLFGVLFIVMLVITFTVTGLIVQVGPWYKPQYVIPIAGMVLGNSMTGMSIALERLFRDMELRRDEINGLVALGATPREAADSSIRAALRAGLIPGINSLSAAGIVFIPGMMSGQILAGASPLQAAPYQIIVLLMISCADIFGSTAAVLLTFRRNFDNQGSLRPPLA